MKLKLNEDLTLIVNETSFDVLKGWRYYSEGSTYSLRFVCTLVISYSRVVFHHHLTEFH